MDKERIQARIAELEELRDSFIKEANAEINRRIGEFDGAIAELKRLLDNDQGESE